MKVTGKITNKMVKVQSNGLIAVDMKDNSITAKSMVKVHIYGLMAVTTQDIGNKINFQVTDNTNGIQVEVIKDNG